MNLKDFTFQLIDFGPIIQELRAHFLKNDPTIYSSTHFLTDTTAEKFQFLTTNFIKIFEYTKQQYPKELKDLVLQLDQVGRIGLHSLSMVGFYPPVKLLSSDEQLPRWEKLILDGRLVGAYAQTELAHGSDVQSLLTKAVYDKEKKSFILSSPGVGATKYWVGCLGMHATHIVTQAQTYISGKHYGLQTFVVPIRDPKTYKLYDGIESGDIGAKLGLPYMDNGYLRFNNLEVPLDNLLMKFLKVKEDGTVTAQGDKNSVKIGYGGMLGLRVILVREFIRDGYKGIMTLYRTWKSAEQLGSVQRRKLLNDFACTYAGLATIKLFREMHIRILEKIGTNLKEALEELDELHITISALKAYYAWVSVDQLRRSTVERTVGNLLIAGSAHIYSDRVPAVTYEGDNVVLLQQTARGLCKYMQYVESEKLSRIPPTYKFLAESRGFLEKPDELKARVGSVEELTSLEKIEEIINAVLLFNVKENYEMMKEGMMSGESPNKLWNEKLQKSMVDMALRVARGLSFKMAKKTIAGEKSELNKKDGDIVRDLVRVYGLSLIQKDIGAVCRFNIGAPVDKIEQMVREALEMVMRRLEGSVEYIGESSPFTEHELVYARDYKEWTPREAKRERLEKSLKEQAERMKQCINSYSKL